MQEHSQSTHERATLQEKKEIDREHQKQYNQIRSEYVANLIQNTNNKGKESEK